MDLDGIIGRVAERQIQEAIEEGKFDNLPGKGKPLVFDDDPMTPPHLRLANKILKNAGVLPDWVQVQKDLEAERREVTVQREKLLAQHGKVYARLSNLPAEHPDVMLFAAWHTKSRETYLRRLKNVNNAILKLSLMAPSTVQPVAPYKLAEETARFDADFPPLPRQPVVAVTETPAESGTLKGLAHERYQAGTGGGPIRSWAQTRKSLGDHPDSGTVGETENEDIQTR